MVAAVMNFNTPDPVDRLQDEAGHLLVRRAIDRDDWIADAILDIAAGKKTHWTPQEWSQLLAELYSCSDKVTHWLTQDH